MPTRPRRCHGAAAFIAGTGAEPGEQGVDAADALLDDHHAVGTAKDGSCELARKLSSGSSTSRRARIHAGIPSMVRRPPESTT
ncbi:hypothetical protein ABH924_001765 [Arthrobacter sp. GAS37]|uniref:hypothetical protein n=1 Tax=Arthrobacter sp. GAS37 TaxID=3156261 RepID=UPI003835FCB6